MADTKLTYFAGKGRGEHIRMILHHTGVVFEDDKLSFEEWPIRKAEDPDYFEFGQMPILVIDGHKLSQSDAIFRYVAQTRGLYPVGDHEAIYQSESLMDGVNDVQASFYKYFFSPAGEGKDAAQAAFIKNIELFLSIVEKRLTANKKSKLHIAGNKLIYGDIKVLNFVWCFAFDELSATKSYIAPILDKFPLTKSYAAHHIEKTFKDYVASKRTQAPF